RDGMPPVGVRAGGGPFVFAPDRSAVERARVGAYVPVIRTHDSGEAMRPTVLAFSLAIMTASSVAAQQRTTADDAALARAREVLRAAPIFDGHNDLPWAIRNAATKPMDVAAYDLRTRTPGHTDLPRLRDGRVGA